MANMKENINFVVSTSINIESPPDSSPADALESRAELWIELDQGQRVRLVAGDPKSAGYTRILENLAELGRPVSLEINPDTDTIETLLIPEVGRVAALHGSDVGYDVELDPSHARHKLDRDLPDFAEFEGRLRQAIEDGMPVILTEDETHNILDIRFFSRGPDGGPSDWDVGKRETDPGRDAIPSSRFRKWFEWPFRLFRPRGCISMAEAQQVFDAMSAKSCNPSATMTPCIPFMYPDDGCWARAHEMCRLMIVMGFQPKKIWIKRSNGNILHAATRNHPNCFIEWTWHVAPTLCVRQGCLFWFWTKDMVIDPSLFTVPVTIAEWKAVQGDPGAILTPSDASVYYLWTNQTDPTYSSTNQYLQFYRTMLENRSISSGPPPYAHCP